MTENRAAGILWTWAGALIIIGFGLYIFHRERLPHEER
jgi:hypothetical protein